MKDAEASYATVNSTLRFRFGLSYTNIRNESLSLFKLDRMASDHDASTQTTSRQSTINPMTSKNGVNQLETRTIKKKKKKMRYLSNLIC